MGRSWRRLLTPRTAVLAVLALAVLFMAWGVSLMVDVHRQRASVARNVHLITKLRNLEQAVAELERGLLEDEPARWEERRSSYGGASRRFSADEATLPGVAGALARIDELVAGLDDSRARLSELSGDPQAESELRSGVRATVAEATGVITATIGDSRGRLAALSADLGNKWNYLNTLVVVSCLLALVTVSLLVVAHRHWDRRRESEERLRLLIEQMPALVWTIDRRCKITSSRGSGLKGLGVENDQLVGMSLFEYLGTDDPKLPAVGAHLRALDGESVNYGMERAGNVYEAHVEPLRDGRGSIVGAVGVGLDVTEGAREKERAQKFESLEVLAGGIAHDFNNFLQAMLGNLSLLRFDLKPDDPTIERVEEAERAADRARLLTKQLLTFTKGGDPIVRDVPVRALVQDSVVFALRGSNVRADFELAEELWCARVDEGQIGQALGNVVINAVQAMPGGGRLRVRARNATLDADPELAAGRYVEVSLQDEGPGIPAEILPKLFDPYFSTKETGSGLGLASAYSVVRRHGGRISVRSTAGQGSTFAILLPSCGSATATARPVREPERGSGRILVMDDEEPILRVAGWMLERLGYEVVEARDGAEAVRIYRDAMPTRPFAAVVMDLTVPGDVGGVAALERIREVDPDVRALASSGHSSDLVMSHYADYGFCGVLPKPYGLEELGRALRDAVRVSVP